MAKIRLTDSLENEYQELFASCEVAPNRFKRVDPIVDKVVANRRRYQRVAAQVGAPWYFIAAIHNMEASLRFDRHLHNGDRLTARTRHVPAGRPKTGEAPFTWEESAVDALSLRRIDRVGDWSLARLLYELEGYNGWGYRRYHAHVKSPYLWSFSNHYTAGKYVADGTWSDTAKSRQCGAAVVVRRLEERGEIEPLAGKPPRGPLLRYATGTTLHGAELQRFLNTFDGISLRVDGWPGARTSDACRRVFGFRLKGDPRR